MPSWQPDWNDVRFDHGAADAAVVELEASADLLVETGASLHRSASVAQEEWRGRYRERFDDELIDLDHRREGLLWNLRADAARIRDAAERARLEQRRREAERSRWFQEAAAEQAAAQTAAQAAALAS